MILIEGIHDPVPPGPHVTWSVGVHHGGVTVTGGVEPHQRHPLAEVGGGKEPVDDFLIGVRRFIGEERINLLKRGWQPGEIKGDAPDQGTAVRQL